MFNVVNYYRFARWLSVNKVPFVPIFIDYIIRLVFSCWLPHTVKAGNELILGYGGLGVVVHSQTVMGARVHIDQCVTIGGNGVAFGVPVIGSDVYIGAGAKLLGPIKIGDNCVIAANAVVLRDVPSGSVVAGVPAKVIKEGILLKKYLYHLVNKTE